MKVIFNCLIRESIFTLLTNAIKSDMIIRETNEFPIDIPLIS